MWFIRLFSPYLDKDKSRDDCVTCFVGWSGLPLHCTEPECQVPVRIMHSTISYTAITPGSVVDSECEAGYFSVSGDTTRTCEVQPTGAVWTGSPLYCKRVLCFWCVVVYLIGSIALFVVVNRKRLWTPAQLYCQKMFDGELASIHSAEENAAILSIVQDLGLGEVLFATSMNSPLIPCNGLGLQFTFLLPISN